MHLDRFLRRAISSAVLTAAVGTCARTPPRPCPAVPSAGVAPAPRRDHCLSPPWIIDPQRPESGVAGWSAERCGTGPGLSAYFIHEGARTPSEPELVAIHRAVAAHLPALATSGLGGCCSPEVAKKHGVALLAGLFERGEDGSIYKAHVCVDGSARPECCIV